MRENIKICKIKKKKQTVKKILNFYLKDWNCFITFKQMSQNGST